MEVRHADQGTVCLYGFPEDEVGRLGRQLEAAGLPWKACSGACLQGPCVLGDGPGCVLAWVDGGAPIPEKHLSLTERRRRRRLVPLVAIVGPSALNAVVEVMRQGAWDVLRAPAGDQELLDTVYEALQVSRTAQPEHLARQRARRRLAQLTHREYEVFCAMAAGGSHREIADALSISPRTLEVHRAGLFRKLRIQTYAELVRMAVAVGVLTRYPELPEAVGEDQRSTMVR